MYNVKNKLRTNKLIRIIIPISSLDETIVDLQDLNTSAEIKGMAIAKFRAASNANVLSKSEPVDILVTASGSRSITDESEPVHANVI